MSMRTWKNLPLVILTTFEPFVTIRLTHPYPILKKFSKCAAWVILQTQLKCLLNRNLAWPSHKFSKRLQSNSLLRPFMRLIELEHLWWTLRIRTQGLYCINRKSILLRWASLFTKTIWGYLLTNSLNKSL